MFPPSDLHGRRSPVQLDALTTTSVEVAAADASARYRVLAYQFSASVDTLITLQSAANEISGSGIQLMEDGTSNVVGPYNPDGWFETVKGEALNIKSNTTAEANGSITYIKISDKGSVNA
jgi:hypothetical protein